MLNNLNKNKVFSLAILSVSLLFYLFFAFYDGALICVDSPSYINMHISREPFYPMFLAFLRALFPNQGEFYLTVAAFLQSILAAVAAWSLTMFLRREMKLSYGISFLVLSVPLAVSFLCRFAAKRSSMYSNSILTEGIACSLFLLFFRFLLDYCYHQSAKSLITAAVISFVLSATRKQMYLTVILLAISIIAVNIIKKHYKRGILQLFLCSLCILAAVKALDYGYNYFRNGIFTTHSSDSRFVETMIFYVSEPEDAENIEDGEIRELFREIYAVCDENGYVKHDAGSGWYNRVSHFGDNYDCIQIDTMWPMLEDYVRSRYKVDGALLEKQVDIITNDTIRSVFPEVWQGMLETFFDNFLSGLVTTVAQQKPVLIAYSLLIYGLYILLLIINIRKEGLSRLSALGMATLLSVILNVAVVSCVIFCQTRYTIYNMPLFYISGLLLLLNICRTFRTERLSRHTF